MNTLKEYEARLMDPKDVSGAYKFCADLAGRHYENFPVASLLIKKEFRRHVAALYAFARIADDFSDEPEYEGVRKERLLDWRRQLDDIGSAPPSHPVFLALGATLKELDLPKQPFDDLLSAFLQDTDKRRYATYDEVTDYCRRSANPVGRIVLMIHGFRDEELFRYSDNICTALQLANFWQDVSVDLKKDRVYIPEEDFAAHGYSEADLRMGVYNDRFKSLMKFEVARTRSLFEQGRPLLSRVKFPLTMELRLTWLGGMQILKKIHRLDFDVIRTRPALKKREWIPLAARALAGA
ncbi:MAG TPA: squalene synthase HpnC [Elusimicrobiota bacterium]|nr:squalene synthase HpnC [Elusimicrobiota bacterium]